MPAFPDLSSPLRSDRVELRFSAERDIPEILIAYQDDPALDHRLGFERPPSGAELGRRSEEDPARREAGAGVRFSILVPGSDACRGQIDVHRVDWDHQRAEAGMWLAPQVRGRGMAPDALRLAAGWLFAAGLARLELLTEPDNAAMIATVRAAGGHEEGVLRAYLRERGRRIDVTILSLLPSDLTGTPAGRVGSESDQARR